MILSNIGKILRIRKIEPDDGVSGFCVRLDGLPDGTSIEIIRECDLRPAYAETRNGVARFSTEFVAQDSDYRIHLKNVLGDFLAASFTVREGVIRRKVGPIDAELSDVWEALLTLLDKICTDEEKLDAIVDGFISE